MLAINLGNNRLTESDELEAIVWRLYNVMPSTKIYVLAERLADLQTLQQLAAR